MSSMASRDPRLTVTDDGCHVWARSTEGPCHKHGTRGCCLIMHATEAAQRAFNMPRCRQCGQFMGADRLYEELCSNCSWTRAGDGR